MPAVLGDWPQLSGEQTGLQSQSTLRRHGSELKEEELPQKYVKYNLSKELRQDILGHFFDGLNYDLSVGKPKNNGWLRKKNTKG